MTDGTRERGGGFATTRWTLVRAAGRRGSPEAEHALAELCEAYWYPLYAFARRRGQDADGARDLTQGFFAHLLERESLGKADPERGRFRTFLLTAMKNYIASEWRRETARKRGGDAELLPLDFESAEARFQVEPTHHLDPDAVYERQWALNLIDRAVTDLRRRYERSGQGELFEALKGSIGREGASVPYPELAVRLALSEGALRTAVSRLRRRWRARLVELVADTVGDPDDVEDEIRGLIDALGHPDGPPR